MGVMACNKCGGAEEMIENKGGVQTGQFTEVYRCVECGARGRISGEADAPADTWDRRGALFAEGV